MLYKRLTLVYDFDNISLNNSPIWKIQKPAYSGEQALRASAANGLTCL